uniref:CSD domain-containing protein n=1 Tax=viral metagenome TaxID=1070528 RepID=A0A6C0EXA6_9ZZZZ
MSSESSSVTSAPVRLTGRVKWFNNKTGFGFISVVGGDDLYKDASEIFVHHSAVTVSQEQYRYLVEGEYVEFVVVSTDSGTHKFQAGDVRGVKGGKLFCETRHEHRASQENNGSGERGRTQVRGGGGVRGGREGYTGGGDRGGERSTGRGGERSTGRGGERSTGRGGYSSSRGGGGGGEWMLVRQNHQEHSDSRGADRERSGRDDRSGQSTEKRPTFVRAAPTEQSSAVAADEPDTPRSAPAKKPRQSKPTA